MITKNLFGVNFLQFEKLIQYPINHAVSMRANGVSKEPYDSLNIALHVGDKKQNVIKNRELFLESTKLPYTLIEMNQTHSTNVVVIDKSFDIKKSFSGENIIKNCDGLITKIPEISLCAMGADCSLALYYDPEHHVLGLVHAGWRGAVDNIHSKMVESFITNFRTNPKDLAVCISPHLCSENLELGKEIIEEIKSIYKENSELFLSVRHGKDYLSIRKLLEFQLKNEGVLNIQDSGICTYNEAELFYSYRREGPKTGRFGLFASLNKLS